MVPDAKWVPCPQKQKKRCFFCGLSCILLRWVVFLFFVFFACATLQFEVNREPHRCLEPRPTVWVAYADP